MKVTINGKAFELHYSLNIYILYEAITGKSIDFNDFAKQTNLIILFYSVVKSSATYHKVECNFNFTEFVDWIDKQGGMVFMNSFAEWFKKAVEAQASIISDLHDKSAEGEHDPNV